MTKYEELRKRFEQREQIVKQMKDELYSVAAGLQASLIRVSGAPEHTVTFVQVQAPERSNLMPVKNEVVSFFKMSVSFGPDAYKATADFVVRHRGGKQAQITYEGSQGTPTLPVAVGDTGVDFIASTIWQKMCTSIELQF